MIAKRDTRSAKMIENDFKFLSELNKQMKTEKHAPHIYDFNRNMRLKCSPNAEVKQPDIDSVAMIMEWIPQLSFDDIMVTPLENLNIIEGVVSVIFYH